MSFSNPITGGQGTLVRPAIKSPDYVPGVSGWSINRDGSVEFNSGTFRGTITAAEIIGSVFGSSLTDPSIWINEDNQNTIRAYNANSNLLLEIGARPGSSAGATFYDAVNPRSLSIGQAISWFQGSPLQTLFTSLYQTVDAVLFNTQLTGGVGFDVANGRWQFIQPGSDTIETWHAPTLATNWATSTTFNGSTNWQSIQYTRTSEGYLDVLGCFKAGATLPGATVCNFVAPYRPNKQWPVTILRNNGGTVTAGMGQITGSGNLNIVSQANSGVAVSNEYLVIGHVPISA